MSNQNLRLARVAYLMLAGAIAGWLIVSRWDELIGLVRGTRIGWLLAALVASFGLLFFSAVIWHVVASAAGTHVPLGVLVHAAARAVLGRYIPGSVWFAVGRIGILRAQGVPAAPLTLAATAEMAFSVTTTIGLGALVLGVQGELPGGAAISLVAAAGIAIAASPPLGGRLLAALVRQRGVELPPMSWRGYLRSLGATTAYWLWAAATFTAYLRAFPATDGLATATIVGGFLFAWGVGFLAIVAPQGIGVFELSLAAILADADVGAIAVVIGGYRIVILVRDVLTAATVEITASKRSAPPSAPTG